MPKRQRNAYDSNFKLQVINFAEQQTNAAAEDDQRLEKKEDPAGSFGETPEEDATEQLTSRGPRKRTYPLGYRS